MLQKFKLMLIMTRMNHEVAIRSIVIIISLIAVLCPVADQSNAAQEASTTSTEKKDAEGPDSDRIDSRLKEIRELLKVAEAAENEQSASQLGTTLEELKERNVHLRNLSAVFMRLLTSLKKQQTLKTEEETLGQASESERGSLISESPPFSLTVYDRYLDRLNEATQEKESAITMSAFYKRHVKDTLAEIDRAKKQLRLLKEDVESYGTKEVPSSLKWQYEFAGVDRELKQAMLDLARLDQENILTMQRIAELKIDISRQQVQWIKERLAFDENNLKKRLESVDERGRLLEDRIASLKKEKISVDDKWVEAQRAFDEAQNAGELVREQAEVYLSAREAWRDTYQRVLDQSEMLMQIMSREKQVWQNRYALLRNEIEGAELDSLRKEANSFIAKVERGLEVMRNYQTNMQSQIASLKSRLSDETLDPLVREHTENRLQAVQKSTERDLEFISTVLGLRELDQRLVDEISERQKAIPVKETLRGLGDWIQSFWELELWVLDDRGVTVSKVVVALVTFLIVLVLAQMVTKFIGKRLSMSDHFDQTAASAVEKVLYYFTLLILLLFALRTVNIPLTVFTVFGGAIAIGLGFGAQNLLNNFISGFILMIERPVKIGDLVQVENHYGVIEEIGSRCTRIRTAANIHILVPNSSFLEKNIINWTLADKKIRTNISVGVVYGSDTRKVKKLMLKAAGDHGKVLKDPEPYVIFNEFGDNALIFDIFFWISIQRLVDRRVIESDLRFIIDELFREADIVIAFPQRDIHIDTTKPLDLRIVKDQEGEI
jgi:small-conductance mechanosensitive channel